MQLESKKLDFIEKFLETSNYEIIPIQSDASLRKYYRIHSGSKSYILMDSSREIGSFRDFIKVTEILELINQKIPKIYSQEENGFIILEDFGDNLVNKIINHENEYEIYKRILDIVIDISKYPKEIYIKEKKFPIFKDYLLEELNLFFDYYLSYKNIPLSWIEKENIKNFFVEELEEIEKKNQVLVLADFHVDNLLLLEDGQIGIIDYQDAMIGSPLYDVVSLLQDARRFVDFELADRLLAYYSNTVKGNIEEIKTIYHILGLQRNIRILGIFARKSIKAGDDSYIKKYEPILKRYIKHSLDFQSNKEFIPSFIFEF